MKNTIKFLCFFLSIVTLFSVAAFAGVTDAETPVLPEEAELKWSIKLGTSYRNAPSVPAIYENHVFIMSSKKLCKINIENGEIVQSADTVSTPSFGCVPPLAENGIVFCPLDDGTVQAFNADTMHTLWVYSDALGGQALSPIVLDNGLIYTGFWNGEELDANYICLNSSDGSLVWSFTHKGGFYWSEPVIKDDFLILGADNGSGNDSDKGKVFSLNKQTGEIADTLEINGDQRSGIASYNGHFYFVTKAGYIYKFDLDSNGKFVFAESKMLSGASTSTPVIYNNKIYIGVQAKGFDGSLCVLDADSLEILNTVSMNGYPQSEVMLTTAYDEIYVYSTYNSSPGGITVISGNSFTAKDLYVPESDNQGCCISPLIASADGTLIYKNDSGTVFAVGKKASEEPEKTFFQKIADWIKSLLDLILNLFR